MAGKYYAVRKGVTPGIYMDWATCKAMVEGYPQAQYKSFRSIEEARSYMEGDLASPGASDAGVAPETLKMATQPEALDGAYAFVDGSFNIATGVYGYGGFLYSNGEKFVLQGSGDDEEMASMRNVAGEILGCQAAVEKAIELGLPKVKIYYDYMGIEMWATGSWKRNKTGTMAYYAYMQSIKDQIQVEFQKVKGHSGVEGNEEADRLAKEAVGIL